MCLEQVSLVVALIGAPPTVYLDEPSTGLDPVASRLMWRLLAKIATLKTTAIVLTTHNMLECEAVCTRVCIMKVAIYLIVMMAAILLALLVYFLIQKNLNLMFVIMLNLNFVSFGADVLALVCRDKLGEMVCLGDTQHLRTVHGTGFLLDVSVASVDDLNRAKRV